MSVSPAVTVHYALVHDHAKGSFMHHQAVFLPHYAPYGFFSNTAASLAFKGEYLDSFSRCYPLGKGRRFYSPILMRFLSPDTLSPFDAGGLNAYAFVLGDPVNLSDPDGRMPAPIAPPQFYYRGPVQVIEGMYVFKTTNASGELVWNILAHGKIGRIGTKRVTFRADAVVAALKKHDIDLVGYETHIFACHSGDGPESFIETMTLQTKKPSRGYKGSVWTDDNRPAIVNGIVENFWIKIIKHVDEGDPDYSRFAYNPVTAIFSDSLAMNSPSQEVQATRMRS
jgi:RHS repeat-associated protein